MASGIFYIEIVEKSGLITLIVVFLLCVLFILQGGRLEKYGHYL